MTKLVLIHGRSQQGKDSVALKAEWLDSWRQGLDRGGLDQPLADEDVRFPFYGDTLLDLVEGKRGGQAADVIVRSLGGAPDAVDAEERAFTEALLREILEAQGIDDEAVRAELDPQVVERGPLQWEWFQAGLRLIDRRVPFGSSASVALFTRDVYCYLTNPGVQRRLHRGIREAFEPGVPTVVVGHSLGSVVAYNLLRSEGARHGWQVPLFLTVGSPLGIRTIRRRLEPIGHPECVEEWRNAMDERDVVALYPLADRFRVEPPIHNKTDVRNHTPNRHGIAGYLDDAEVARWIHDALI